MSEEERFDAIVVGGGLSGITAAYVMAQSGLAVLLIEKGTYSGSKNVTGGRLYTHSLEKVIPNFEEAAPLERKIATERFSALIDEGYTTWEYPSANILEPAGSSYSVLRGKFDRWFADKAEEAGVLMVYGVKVDELLVRDGAICGVVAGDEEMEANVVVLADGANSLLAQKLEMKDELNPKMVAVGAKEVLALSPTVIEERFGVNPGEGLAWIFHGCATDNLSADGFLYTNKDSVSVGITMGAESISSSEKSVPQLLEDFKHHPAVEKLLEGGSLLEYSAHLLPEGGNAMRPKLAGNGVLLVGDAAALCMDLGYSIRGMDLAIESGRLAAEAIIAATQAEDFSEASLSAYVKALDSSFIATCLSQPTEIPAVLQQAVKLPRYSGMGPCSQAPVPRVEDKLGKNKFHTDEHHSHIDVDKEYSDKAEIEKVIRACPAGLYKLDDKGTLFFDYLGCLECGTCRVLSGGRVIKDWQYPEGSLGVEFRMG